LGFLWCFWDWRLSIGILGRRKRRDLKIKSKFLIAFCYRIGGTAKLSKSIIKHLEQVNSKFTKKRRSTNE